MALTPVLTPEQLDRRWAELRAMLDSQGLPSGASSIKTAIAREPDDVARNQLFRFAVRKLGGTAPAQPEDLDAMIELARAAIDNAKAAATRHTARQSLWLDEGNVSAFNASANLCDCWGDGDSRTTRHFEAGLAFADEALALRHQLNKGPGPFSMAHWARGKHLLSLKRARDAAEAFGASLTCEREMAGSAGSDQGTSRYSPSSLLLANAFLELATWRAQPGGGRRAYDEACALMQEQADHGEGDVKDDAKAYLEQVKESERLN